MSIKSLGLLMSVEALELLEQELIENFLNKDKDASREEVNEIFKKHNIEFIENQKEELINVIQQMTPTIINGYKTQEDYDNDKHELISSGFIYFDSALFALRNSDFDTYGFIEIRSKEGHLSDLFTRKEFVETKSKIINGYVTKIRSYQKAKSIAEERINKLTINDSNPFASVGDDYINKADLNDLFETTTLIYNKDVKVKILELLKEDQLILDSAIKASQEHPERVLLEKKVKNIISANKVLHSEIDNSVDFRTVLDMSTSNIEAVEINKFLETDIMKGIYLYKQNGGKYVLFTETDIRDDLQDAFKEVAPKSKHNLKSRTMVKDFNLSNFVMSLPTEEVDCTLVNIL